MREQIIDARVATGRVLRDAKTALVDLMAIVRSLAGATSGLATNIAVEVATAKVALKRTASEELSIKQAVWFTWDALCLLKDLATITAALSEVERRVSLGTRSSTRRPRAS